MGRVAIAVFLALVAAAAAELRTTAGPNSLHSIKPVTTLPGWDGELPVKTYSGFVETPGTAPAKTTMKMHFQISICELGFDNCPVLVWWNGGPGAPSSWGVYIENGPFLLNEESYTLPGYAATGIPQLVRNPYSWTKFATMVSFANPPPSGFSYCDPPGPGGNGSACGMWTDQRVGETNAEALLAVFTEFVLMTPAQDLFFVGESYAGVYISSTTEVVATNPRYAPVAGNLAGVALGDACMGSSEICGSPRGVYDSLLFFYGHGQLPTQFWEKLLSVCTMQQLRWTKRALLPKACGDLVSAAYDMVGEFYTYNLYDNCPNDMFAIRGAATADAGTFPKRVDQERQYLKGVEAHHKARRSPAESYSHAAHFNGYWCPGKVFEDYMNRTDVRVALGVPLDSLFFIADDARGMPYTYTLKDAFPFWSELLHHNNATAAGGRKLYTTRPLRLMSYNGDADPAVEMFATQDVWYSFAANYSFAKSAEWRAWNANPTANIVGGYIVEWFGGALSYATVRGSGHMVPEYRPMAAMALISAFVQGKAPTGNKSPIPKRF